MKLRIKFKIISFITVLLLVVITLLSFFVLRGIRDYQQDHARDNLIKQKDIYEQYISERFNADNSKSINNINGNIFNKPWLRTIPGCIYDKEGNIISGFKPDGHIKENSKKDTMVKYALKDKMGFIESNNYMYFYSPLKYKDSFIGILELEYSTKDDNKFYSHIKGLFYSTGILSLVIGTILAIIYFQSLIKDIYFLRTNVKAIQNGNFSKVYSINRKDELGELSNGIVFMSNTIEKNIEELKEDKHNLSSAVEKLKEMDKQQKEFISNVTHEFKTPITAIKAYADAIRIYTDDLSLIQNGTKTISEECQRLTSMVDRILSLSAMERYDFQIEKTKVNIKHLLEQISTSMMGKIIKNELSLKCNLDDISIWADEESIKHILINLIDNAIKYNTPGGNITLGCYKKDNEILIEIADTGIGISEDNLFKIFQPFYRVEDHRSSQTGGAGLGLALVKKLVEKQNGHIIVKSKLNEGSTFSLTFSD